MKCRFPIQLNVKGRQIYVPCGKCAWCLQLLRQEWFVRLRFEASKHLYRSFVTLTYRDDDLPFSLNEETGEMVPSVRQEDVVSFHRKLWKKGYVFRFMLCSEYGPHTHRPHYHGVYFHDTPISFIDHWPYGDNNTQYPAKDGSFLYISKYMLKGSNVPEGATPNFRTMSRRPGIGSDVDYDPDSLYFLCPDGKKLTIPRYYKKKYTARLDKQLRNCYSEMKLDYLASLPQHDQFHKIYDSLLLDGSISPDYPFEDWLSDIYKKDFVKQVKINSK